MAEKVKKIIRVILFCAITAACITVISLVIIPKWDETIWTPANTQVTFYNTEKNSIDVTFHGSSVMASAFDPFKLYKDQGISSYNLALQSQNMIGSYYWIKETLNYQNPRVVVLDVKALGHVGRKAMAKVRKSYEYMRWGAPKLEFAFSYWKERGDVNLWSYIFPPSLYHSRWSDLVREDFDFVAGDNVSDLRGYCMLDGTNKKAERPGIVGNGDPSGDAYIESEKRYLDQIIALCKEKNVNLLFVRTFDTQWKEDMHAYAKRVAEENSIPFIDFNTTEMIEELRLNAKEDLSDYLHVNMRAADKMSDWLGTYLKKNYDLTDHRKEDTPAHAVFSDGMETYEMLRENCTLSLETDFDSWLSKISDADRYTILLTAKKMNLKLSEKERSLLDGMGFSKNLQEKLEGGKKDMAVATVFGAGTEELKKKWSKEHLHGMFPDHAVYDVVVSEEQAAVRIDNTEVTESDANCSIIVYDSVNKKVADKVQVKNDDDGNVVIIR